MQNYLLLAKIICYCPCAFKITDNTKQVIFCYKLAECVALWGEPEQAVHGMKERGAAASSGMKGKRVTIRLVVAFAIALHLRPM